MPRLKQLSGKDVVKFLESHGFFIKRTKGSHVRMTLDNKNHSFHITIPLHSALKKGTVSGIAKELETILDQETVKNFFYTI